MATIKWKCVERGDFLHNLTEKQAYKKKKKRHSNLNPARQSPYAPQNTILWKVFFNEKSSYFNFWSFFYREQISQRISKICSASKNGRVRKNGQWIFSLTFYELKCIAKYPLYIFSGPYNSWTQSCFLKFSVIFVLSKKKF